MKSIESYQPITRDFLPSAYRATKKYENDENGL